MDKRKLPAELIRKFRLQESQKSGSHQEVPVSPALFIAVRDMLLRAGQASKATSSKEEAKDSQ